MGYILVDAKELDRQKIRHGEVLPDGRTLLDMSMMKVMESTENIEFISTEAEVRQKLMAMGYSSETDKGPAGGSDTPLVDIQPAEELTPSAEEIKPGTDEVPAEQPQDDSQTQNDVNNAEITDKR